MQHDFVYASGGDIRKPKITTMQNCHLFMDCLGVGLALMILWRTFEKTDGQVEERGIKVWLWRRSICYR